MPVHTLLSAAVLPRSLRLGPLHFTPYGLFAALGLIAAMALARRSAHRSGADPEAIWDAGLFAIFNCFVASRLLLILWSPTAFLRSPLLLLGLPSLTLGGLALAALATGLYLYRKRLPLWRTLDLFASPAALLAVFLEVGHWADGSEVGAPTKLPWGVSVAGMPGALRVHPVALYGILLSLALTLWLWTTIPRASLQASQTTACAGQATSRGLLVGGLLAFVLDMLSAPPAKAFGGLEPGQWIALTAMFAGALVWALRPLAKARNPAKERHKSVTHSPLHMEVH